MLAAINAPQRGAVFAPNDPFFSLAVELSEDLRLALSGPGDRYE
jgi:hypothetical protein